MILKRNAHRRLSVSESLDYIGKTTLLELSIYCCFVLHDLGWDININTFTNRSIVDVFTMLLRCLALKRQFKVSFFPLWPFKARPRLGVYLFLSNMSSLLAILVFPQIISLWDLQDGFVGLLHLLRPLV